MLDKPHQPQETQSPKERHQGKHHQLLLHGIDLSHHNGEVDWKKVKQSKVAFAFIKATEGVTYNDTEFADNWRGAQKVGIRHGAYHFFSPHESVHKQVNHFLSSIKHQHKGSLPPVLDVEDQSQWRGLSHKQSADKVLTWLHAVHKHTGVIPIIYMSPSFAQDVLGNDKRLAHYPLWIAHYDTRKPDIPQPFKHYSFWQFSEKSHLKGVSGQVDGNYFNGTLSELAKLNKVKRG